LAPLGEDALDYLTTPVEPERLKSTLVRVKDRVALEAALTIQEQLKSVLAALKNGESAKRQLPRRLSSPTGQRTSLWMSTTSSGLRPPITTPASMSAQET